MPQKIISPRISPLKNRKPQELSFLKNNYHNACGVPQSLGVNNQVNQVGKYFAITTKYVALTVFML